MLFHLFIFFCSAASQNPCPGSWVLKTPKTSSSWEIANRHACPFTVENKPAVECIKRDSSNRHFELNGSILHGCRDFEPRAFLETFSNSRLYFIGDSVLMQVWLSLVCDLYSSLPVDRRDNSSFVKFYPQTDAGKWKGGYRIGRDIAVFVEKNVTIVSSHWGWFYKQGSGYTILQEMSENDRVVINFGLHYNEYSGKNPRDADRSDYQMALQALSADIVALNRPSWKIFFTEITPQHFSGDNPNGYFNSQGGKSCRPHSNATLSQQLDWRNNILRNRNVSHLPDNVILIPLDALGDQWDAHPEMDESHSQGQHLRVADCTHWFNPSGALRYIQVMLLNALS